MRTIFIFKGIPGSGKSTEARNLMAKEPGRWKRVNRDDLRSMLDANAISDGSEDLITKLQEQMIRASISAGFDVIVDNTHLKPWGIKRIHRIAESIGDVNVLEKGFNVLLEECVKRNNLRVGAARVPEQRLREMHKSAGLDKKTLRDSETYYPPRAVRGTYVQDNSLPKAILCDLDGTLALMGDRDPYDASTCDQDLPNWPVIENVLAMHARGHKVIFMSGREDKYREQTRKFICRYCRAHYTPEQNSMFSNGPIDYELHMRPSGDQRKDSIVKRELFDAHVAGKYFVTCVYDDRDQVVEMWRNELMLTTMQVAYGNF